MVCYGCGHKAPWDEVAPKLNLEPFTKGPPKDEYAMDFMTKALSYGDEEGFEQGKFKFWPIPSGKVWREIPTDFLIELGGQMCYKWYPDYNRWGSTKMIHFPVEINGRQVGFFRARLRKATDDQPSYLNAGGPWSKTHGLWPLDYASDLARRLKIKTIALVEGQRDALRLLLNGIPAVCIFGTQSWSEMKLSLLEIAGFDRVVLMFDGDDAGISATEKIRPSVRTMFKTHTVKLWNMKGSPYRKVAHFKNPSKAAKRLGLKLWDPGNLPQPVIDQIAERYFTR
jgi:5S rRNA maturation endonuclease (ribonuclease M5)